MSTVSKSIKYPSIGTVLFKKSTRASRIGISVRPLKNISVSIPVHISFEEAERFVSEKIEWIQQAQQKISKIERKQTIFTDKAEFCTKFRRLKLIAESRKNLTVKVVPGFVEVYYPDTFELTHEGLQEAIRKAIEHAWRIEAHEYLPRRIEMLAQQYDLPFSKLTIKNTRSFWGNCSRTKAIVLSLHLMHLPDELIDYVILHELCHTKHMNHGKDFWILLDKVTNQRARPLDKEMKKHSTRIY